MPALELTADTSLGLLSVVVDAVVPVANLVSVIGATFNRRISDHQIPGGGF